MPKHRFLAESLEVRRLVRRQPILSLDNCITLRYQSPACDVLQTSFERGGHGPDDLERQVTGWRDSPHSGYRKAATLS